MPDNAFYAQAAYVAAVVVYGVYALSVWRRRRQLDRRRAAVLRGRAPSATRPAGAEGLPDTGEARR